MTTEDDLLPVHFADLRALAANPRKQIQPQRRKMFIRLGLIEPVEPPRPPLDRVSHPPVRAHVLTKLGVLTLAEAPL